MTIETIPAPSQVTTEQLSTSNPAPEVKATSQEQSVTPPADTASADAAQAGKVEANQEIEKKPEELTEGQKRRKERNQQRWQAMSRTAERVKNLEAELSLYRPKQVDYTQIADQEEAIAERTSAKVMERQAAAKEFELRQAQQEQARAMQEAIGNVLQDGRERMPDFDQVFNATVPLHDDAVPHILESEKAAEIAYYLGKNPEVAKNLKVLFDTAPTRALIELGRIEAQVSAPAAKTVTRAPAPAPILNGGQNPLQFDAARASVDDMAAYLRKAGVIT